MMNKMVIASKNKGKVKEIKKLLSDMPFDVISMLEEDVDIDIVEDGRTFEENALIKAKAVKNHISAIVVADDSGLEVDYLDGAPGIYSARFAGEGSSDEQNYMKLLSMLEGVEESKRTARFVCAIAVVLPDNSNLIVKGECEGRIGFKPEGDNGFGYDPLFYIPQFDATMAQLDISVKNSISHRAKALGKLVKRLNDIFMNE